MTMVSSIYGLYVVHIYIYIYFFLLFNLYFTIYPAGHSVNFSSLVCIYIRKNILSV